MRVFSCLIVYVSLLSYGVAADSTPAPQPATTAPPADSSAVGPSDKGSATDPQIVFGVIALSDDRKTLTISVKKSPLVLEITERTEVTSDLKRVALTSLNLNESVRVTYSGTTALSIDQLKAGKKRKKKPE